MLLFDSHAHLGAFEFAADADVVIQRARNVGVKRIANCADSAETFQSTMALKERYPETCLACWGIHPEFAAVSKDVLAKAITAIKKNSARLDAIGEVGLDYHYTAKPELRARQREIFALMRDLAIEYGKPLVVHAREADEDVFGILTERKPVRVDLHCYAGDWALAQRYLDSGLDIRFGIGGVITFKNAAKTRELVSHLPLDRIMLETDSPCLAPVPLRGQRNEPRNLFYVLKAVSDLRMESLTEVAAAVYASTEAFYGKNA